MKIAAFAASFITTIILTPLVIRYSHKKGLLDYPKEKSIHTHPTPMVGGLVIFFVFFAMSLIFHSAYNLLPLFAASIALLASGLYDDIKGLNATWKLIVQCFAATVLVLNGIIITDIKMPFGPLVVLGWLAIPITIFWLVFITNLVNLLDGLDGLATGLLAIVFFVLSIVTFIPGLETQLAILMGAILAFLIFNFYPAKIFLGNSGSAFLGLSVGYFSIVTAQKSTVMPILIIPCVILLIQIVDVALAIVRRTRNGTGIFTGDRYHIHHRMLGLVKGQRLAVLLFYLCSLILALAALKIWS